MDPSKLEAGRAMSATLPLLENGVVSSPPAENPGAFASKWGTLVAPVLRSIGGAGDARIERLLVAEADHVVEGQPLGVLDNSSRDRVTGSAVVRVLEELGRARGTTTVMVTLGPGFSIWRIESSRWKTECSRSTASTQASMGRRVQP